MVVLALLMGTITQAAQPETNQTLRLAIDLVDGSFIIGIPAIKSVPIQTAYAKMDIPLKQIRIIRIGDDHEAASFELLNGDKLKGIMDLKSIELETILGNVHLSPEYVTKAEVHRGGVIPLPHNLKKDVVLHYSCNDSGPRVWDNSGNANHAIADGLRHTSLGKLGGCYVFEGDGLYIEAKHPTNLPTGDNDRTVMLWFRTSSSIGQICLFSYGGKTSNRAFGASINSQKIYVNAWMNGFFAGSKVTDNEWHHLAVVHVKSKGRTCYIDGVLSGFHQGSVNTEPGTPFWVGKWVIPLEYFKGQIDEVLVFKKALPEKDVKQLYDLQK